MRCGPVQRHLTAAVDGRLDARSRAAVDEHVAGCAACREELRLTRALFTALDDGSTEAPVSPRLEQATLRAVRIAAADEAERPARWWAALRPAPALAVLAVVVVAVTATLQQRADAPARSAPKPARLAAQEKAPKRVESVARAKVPAEAPAAAAPVVARRRPTPVPAEPPKELAERPDLFIDLPILRHLDKLEHFEQIETTGLPDAPAAPTDGEGPTNG